MTYTETFQLRESIREKTKKLRKLPVTGDEFKKIAGEIQVLRERFYNLVKKERDDFARFRIKK